MTDSPFSPDRLRELRWSENYTLRQIATLASASTGEACDEPTVVEWFRAGGIAWEKSQVRAEPVFVRESPRRGRMSAKNSLQGLETRPCGYCGADVTRRASDMRSFDRVFCCQDHQLKWQSDHMTIRAADRRAELAQTERKCYKCGHSKPLDNDHFPRDKNDSTGFANICRECNNAKSCAWYEANRDRKIARTKAYKKGKSKNGNTGTDAA